MKGEQFLIPMNQARIGEYINPGKYWARVILTDYANFIVWHVCDFSSGAQPIDRVLAAVRSNASIFLDVLTMGKVYFTVLDKIGINPLELMIVGRSECVTRLQ